ncbi:MAG: response regulator [Actinobacteria bacterium]|nr:response regulator [Actinomycetota bacterium]
MATILVVEDDPAVSSMLEMTLAVEGFETEILSDGTAALARLDDEPPDLVILDIMMPGANGYTVLEALRGREAWEDVPVIMATALSGDEDVWRGWSAGADYYLSKPFSLDHLRSVVLRLLSGETPLP